MFVNAVFVSMGNCNQKKINSILLLLMATCAACKVLITCKEVDDLIPEKHPVRIVAETIHFNGTQLRETIAA